MNITEFRQQYPQYNDMSDAVVTKNLHEKYYSDIPYEQFSSKFGVENKVENKAASQPRARFNVLDEIKKEGSSDTLHKRFVGLGKGFVDTGEGLKQKYLQGKELFGMAPEGTSDGYQKQIDSERNFYDKTPYGQDKTANASRLLGDAASFALMPGGVAGGMLKRMLTGGLAGAGVGFSRYVPEGESGLLNTLVGTGLGAGAPLLMGLLTKGINAVAGVAGTPEQAAVIKSGKEHNVPVFTADVSNNPVVQGASYGLQNMPPIKGLSMVPDRQNQMYAAQNAAQKVTDDLHGNMVNTPYGGKSGMQKINQAANNPSSVRADSAKKLLDEMANTGDDWNRVVQTSGNANLLRGRLIADRKYGKVSKIADKYGDVNKPNTMQAIDDAMNTVKDDVLPNTELLTKLQTMQRNFSKNMNYSQMRQARGTLSSLIDDYYKGANAAIGGKGVGSLQAIKKSVGMDMDSFAQANGPQLKTVWQNADSFYRNSVAPAKDRLLAQSLTNKNPDEVYNQWVKTGDKKDRATRFYHALDNKGKAAVRYGMVNDAYQKSVNQDGLFSPGSFGAEMKKYKGAKDAFFQGKDRAEIDGFSNLMTHVRSSFETMSKPRTGERVIPWLAAGGAGLGYGSGVVSGGSIAAGLAGVAGIKQLMTSTWGRNYLIAASKLKAGTPAMQSLAETLSRLVQRAGVVGAINKLDNKNQ